MLINDVGIPLPIYDAMVNHGYTGSNCDYSISQLEEDPRIVHGKKLMKDCNKKVSDELIMFLGTLVHDGLKHKLLENLNYSVEKRLSHIFQVNGNPVVLSGEYDVYCYSEKLLIDYKTTVSGGWKMKDKKLPKYYKQVQRYRYLRAMNGLCPTERMAIIFIITDWRQQDTITNGYPKSMFMEVEVPNETKEKTLEGIMERLEYLEKYKDKPISEMPYCSPENRWHQDDIWKVIKLNKDGTVPEKPRAINGGNCKTREEAEELSEAKGELYAIQFYQGGDKRCEKYCDLSKNGYCDFLKTKGGIDA